jgi:beta-carotene hydroxylase
MLKNRADIKTLVWAVLITAVWAWNWSLPEFQWLPFLLACFGGVVVSSMVHNHVHVSVFRWPILNVIYDYWLSVIYGYAVFAWISTHNKNHHVYNNRAGDFAPSYMYSEKNNLFTLLAYPTVSGGVQQKVNFDYLKELWQKDRARCLYYVSQFVAVIGVIVVALLVDWKKALLYVVVPQQVALNTVLIFNYLQHIHCDEESKYNHSRNVVSPRMNFFLLNNGYHTAHHMKPLLHWSELKKLHEKISPHIDPSLNEPHFIWMLVRMYLLAPFFPSLMGKNMRAERIAGGRTETMGVSAGAMSPEASV